MKKNVQSNLLRAPELPQATYDPSTDQYDLDVALLNSDIEIIAIYSGQSTSDLVTMFVGESITREIATPPSTVFRYARNEFPDGVYRVYYMVTEAVGNTAKSEAVKLKISNAKG